MSGPDAAAAWLLTAAERGNPATTIDAARADGLAWTVGNLVEVHIDGEAYFARLHARTCVLPCRRPAGAGGWLRLGVWRGSGSRWWMPGLAART
jgi:hypothetical protein